MRFPIAILALFATFSSAFAMLVARQTIMPNCAVPCLTNANFGNCSSTDDSCLCHSAAFINSTTTCIQSSCTGSDLTNAEEASQELCAAVGVTLSSASQSATGSASTPTTTSTSDAVLLKSINVLTGAAAIVILVASL